MIDGSGFALYNNLSGNSAFLSTDSHLNQLAELLAKPQFSQTDFQHLMKTDEKRSGNSLIWLIKNDFLIKIESDK